MLPSLERLTLGAGTDAILISDKPIQPKELKTGESVLRPTRSVRSVVMRLVMGMVSTWVQKAQATFIYTIITVSGAGTMNVPVEVNLPCPICREEVVVKGKTSSCTKPTKSRTSRR